MSDTATSIEIEFSDEELSPDFEQPKQGAEDVKEQEPVQAGKTEEEPKETKPADEGSKAPESKPAEGNSSDEGSAPVEAKTNAELAALHGVTEEEIAYAKNMGWAPKENFRGNPSDWKGPKEFIDIAEQSGPVLRERLREMSKKMAEMQKAFPTILDMQKRELQNRVDNLTSANEQLQKELEEAHYLADSKRAVDISEKIMENKLKIALTKEEEKHVGEPKGDNKTIVPDNIDVEKERAWRDSLWPKLTMEQREKYNEGVKFIMLPQNADQTTDQRIAYMERKIFGVQDRPSVAPVAKPSAAAVVSDTNTVTDEYAGWNAMSDEEKRIATSMLADFDWYQHRDTTGKAKWNEFKKQFTNK